MKHEYSWERFKAEVDERARKIEEKEIAEQKRKDLKFKIVFWVTIALAVIATASNIFRLIAGF